MLPPSIVLTEVAHGNRLLGDLFQRKFGGSAPDYPHHLVAFHVPADGSGLRVVSYAHFNPFGDVCLVGGVCTDGEVVRALAPVEQEQIRAAGGVYFHLVRYGFSRFRDKFAAFFGYVGDARSMEVNLAAGFQSTDHPHLIINPRDGLPDLHVKALTAKVLALGPF